MDAKRKFKYSKSILFIFQDEGKYLTCLEYKHKYVLTGPLLILFLLLLSAFQLEVLSSVHFQF